MLRVIRAAISDVIRPIVWIMGLFPPILLNGISAFFCGLFIVFVFGFGLISFKVLLHPEQPVTCFSCQTDEPDFIIRRL